MSADDVATRTGDLSEDPSGQPEGIAAHDYVATEDGRRFRVVAGGENLRGGQGTIERLVGTQLAVKRPKDDDARARWDASRAREVRLLALEDLDISRPLFVLHGELGYVMHLIDGTRPIRTLIAEPDDPRLEQTYHRVAGLRRRLRLLGRIAQVLSRIHGRGLVYADLSAGNVMVSDPPHENVWLVDVDNVTVAGTASFAPYTPGFAPPELLEGGHPPTRHVDAYSFAVLAFRVLVQLHPLLGATFAGKDVLEPDEWIEHPSIRDRFAGKGLARDHVHTAELRELFRLCFEDGLSDPDARPDLATWARALFAASDDAVACPGCRKDRLGIGPCPWCGRVVRGPLLALMLDCVPGRPPVPSSGPHGAVALAPGATTLIEERHRTGRLRDEPLKPILSITRDNDRVLVRAASGRACHLVAGGGRPTALARNRGRRMKTARPGEAVHVVHLGDAESYHRAVAIVPDPRGGTP